MIGSSNRSLTCGACASQGMIARLTLRTQTPPHLRTERRLASSYTLASLARIMHYSLAPEMGHGTLAPSFSAPANPLLSQLLPQVRSSQMSRQVSFATIAPDMYTLGAVFFSARAAYVTYGSNLSGSHLCQRTHLLHRLLMSAVSFC